MCIVQCTYRSHAFNPHRPPFSTKTFTSAGDDTYRNSSDGYGHIASKVNDIHNLGTFQLGAVDVILKSWLSYNRRSW